MIMDEIMTINKIEKRFLKVSGLDCNLNKFPLKKEECSKTTNNKDKSKLHGEVFTPLWFVDKMILKASDSLKKAKTTHDLCAGYGQFTVRMLRFLANNRGGFRPETWLKEVHSFSEYQISSVYKLLYIFGADITLFIGDAKQLEKLKDTDEGILFYSEKKNEWFNITNDLITIFKTPKKYSKEIEDKFIEKFDKMKRDKEKKGGQTMLFGIDICRLKKK